MQTVWGILFRIMETLWKSTVDIQTKKKAKPHGEENKGNIITHPCREKPWDVTSSFGVESVGVCLDAML